MYGQFITIIFAAFFLTGCGFRKPVPVNNITIPLTGLANVSTVEAIPQKYVIEVGDVECDLCAHAVENVIAAIPGVMQVNYEDKNGNYEKGQLKVTAQTTANLTEKNLTELLSDNGFLFRKISKS